MTIPQLRELAAWHDAQAEASDLMAASYEKTAETVGDHLTHTAAAIRTRGQWHASTAIHLRELADAFSQVFTAIQP